MNTIRQRVSEAFDFPDFEPLCEAVEDDEADTEAFYVPLWAGDIPFRRVRVIDYCGSPGAMVACPVCNIPGRRVDGWGGYACQNCGYSNLQERPTPRSLH